MINKIISLIKRKITYKFISLAFFLAFTGSIITIIAFQILVRPIVLNESKVNLNSTLHGLMNKLNHHLDEATTSIKFIAQNDLAIDSLLNSPTHKTSSFLRNIKNSNKTFSAIEIYNAKGYLISSSSMAMYRFLKNNHINYEGSENWFLQAKKGNFVVGRLEASELYSGNIINTVHPVFNPENDEIIGYIRGVFSWYLMIREINTFLSDKEKIRISQNTQNSINPVESFILIDELGTIYFHQDPTKIGTRFDLFDITKTLKGDSGSFLINIEKDHEILTSHLSVIESRKGKSFIKLTGIAILDQPFAILDKALKILIIILTVNFFLIIAYSTLVIKKAVSPLVQMTGEIKSIIKKGSLNTKVKKQTQDEAGQLVDSFNTLFSKLQDITVSRDYLNNIMNTIGEMLFLVDENGKIVFCNRAVSQILDYQPEKLQNVNIDSLIYDNHFFQKMKNNNFDYREKSIFLSQKEIEVPVLISSSPMSQEGPSEAVILALDISRSTSYERQVEKNNEALYHLIIQDCIRSAYGEALHREIKEKHDSLSNNTRVNNILKKYETLIRKDSSRPAEIKEIIEDALNIVRYEIRRHKIKLIKDLSSTNVILKNKFKLIQLLINILDQAIQSLAKTDSQQKYLIISTESTTNPDNIKITISHNGSKASDIQKEDIFPDGPRFYMCKTLAKEMGSDLSMDKTDQGPGELFIIDIPVN